MKEIIKILQHIIIGIGLVIIFSIIAAQTNICYCEEALIMPPEILDALKTKLIESLIELTKGPAFREKYGSDSGLFTILYITNSHYINNFVENLPLIDILRNPEFQDSTSFMNRICELFYEDISAKKRNFGNRILHIFEFLSIFQFFKPIIALHLDINEMITHYEPSVHTQGNIPIYTERALQAGEIIMRRANDRLHALETLNLGIVINIENGNNGVEICLRYIINFKPYLLPEVVYFFEPHSIFTQSKFGVQSLIGNEYSFKIIDIINYLKLHQP